MQVVMNKCFPLNPEKKWHRSVLSFPRKLKNRLTPTQSNSEKNYVTEPKVRSRDVRSRQAVEYFFFHFQLRIKLVASEFASASNFFL